ncbi:MAG: L,D-transpeptidase [Rhizobiaceae bacterium]
MIKEKFFISKFWTTACFLIFALSCTETFAAGASRTFPLSNEISKVQFIPVGNVPRDHGPVSKKVVEFQTTERPGTIIISNSNQSLHHVLGGGKAAKYKISVGRDGFSWTGTTIVGRKSEWPDWRPPAEMRKREPNLPKLVPAGPFNPLGARAIYLFQNGRDTLYRIHGTNTAETIGGYETSGCFRLSNADALELYGKVKIGSKVIVRN